MLRYSLKRLVLFVVCLAVTWLAFGRPTSVDGFIWPFAVAAVASAVLAYPMLRAERERFGAQIDRRVDAHLVHKHEQDSAMSPRRTPPWMLPPLRAARKAPDASGGCRVAPGRQARSAGQTDSQEQGI